MLAHTLLYLKTYLVQQLADHAVPFAQFYIKLAVLAVIRDLNGIIKSEDLGYFSDQVDAEPLVTVVSSHLIGRFPQHCVRCGLEGDTQVLEIRKEDQEGTVRE